MLGMILRITVFYIILQLFRNRRAVLTALKTLPRDIYAGWILAYVNIFIYYLKVTNQTTSKYFDTKVERRREKPCFYFEDEVWTYGKVQEESYKVANYFNSLGFRKGDTVALVMENRPDYVTLWLGLSRIGVITSLVNYNIRLKGLEHCVRVANCKAIIFGSEMTPAIQEVLDSGGFQDLEFFCMDDRKSQLPHSNLLSKNHINLTTELKNASKTPVKCFEEISTNDVALLVYTSGTTGLPKASLVRHGRIFSMSASAIGARLQEGKDILMTPVPLYHVQGGILGTTAAMFYGVPQVILRKFSASKFWEQCIRYDATASQYLGEIIRYLYNQPEKPEDKLHKVKTFFGNGVNPAIWMKFVERFNNVKIKEIYGATEGNCNMMNVVGQVGACGFVPIWAMSFLPYFFAKVDDVTGEVLRDTNGLVIPAEVGEPGELLGKISSNPMRQFDGYTDKEESKKKILSDVRKKGDKWFRSGDLLVLDEYGYWYFKDRFGDTFRWKGENVSTAEVEEVVTRSAGMKGAVVFGVQVPGAEGRCGMGVISDPERNLDLETFTYEINKCLPSYARPLFLRVTHKEMNMTGTFKLQKVDLQKEGFDRERIKDPIYFLKEGHYVSLNQELYQDVISGKMRF